MKPDLGWEAWSRDRAERVERLLEQALNRASTPRPLHDAMRYAVLGGGKRVRALLAYAAGESTGADEERVGPAAAAVELIHAYSLVHDDLPCMDDDAMRRGKPSCHAAFGEAMALLAGDALQSLAFEALARSPADGLAARIELLARAAGACGMAGGQAIDLASVGTTPGLADLERMHGLKTGALIRAAVALGAGCGNPDARQSVALDRYASAIGLAFQIVDDVLDVEGTASSLGKTAGKDAAQQKPTYVSLLGLAAARARIEALRAEARAALAGLEGSRRLLELADWNAVRSR